MHVVLDAIGLALGAGETAALCGRSGSGKSTLLNLLSGIDRPDAGRIVIDGVDLTAASERERTLYRRANVGFVYQAFNLVPTLTAADNVRLVLELNGERGRAADDAVAELLARVGLDGRGHSYPDLLSGGEQQRIAIARAIVHRPRLVLADEPTGNLDDQTAASVLDLLSETIAEAGSTLVMATHSRTVAATCDRVFDLKEGRLEERGRD